MLVLLVEDSVDDQLLFQRAAQAAGPDVRVQACADSGEALGYLVDPSNERPDLLIIDISLPKLSGIEFTELVRMLYKQDAAPIVATSSDASPRAIQAALAAGAQEFMLKPTNFNQFAAEFAKTIQRWLPKT